YPDARIDGVLVERMVAAGLEVFIGARLDPNYGPVVLFGPGGSGVETRAEPIAALAPFDWNTAFNMVDAMLSRRLSSSESAERDALAGCLMAIGGPEGMVILEHVEELDINPLIISGSRAVAVDAVVGLSELDHQYRSVGDMHKEIEARRERLSGLDAIFDPKAIAFIGASNSEGKIGNQSIKNMQEFGYTGTIYPVHPTADEICGLQAYPSVEKIPADIDRAYIMVGSNQVPDVLAQCKKKGVKVAQVLTAGFSEFSEDSTELEQAMMDQVHGGSMRMIGPNCIGTFSSKSRMPIGAARYNPIAPGGITFFSQSGTYAGDVVRRAQVWGLPLGQTLSCGNCKDLDILDYLLYADSDPQVDIIAFYVESLRDPGLFFRQVASMSKPVVMLRGGQTEQGLVAASSHTAALATDQLLWDAGLRHSGVIQVSNVDDLMDTLLVLSVHGRGAGRQMALFGSGGGISVTASDAAANAGLSIPSLTISTEDKLRRFGIPGTSVANPIDIPVWGLRDGDRYIFEEIINLLKADQNIDRIVVFVEMGWVMDFADSDEAGLKILESICDSIGRAQSDGTPLSLALRSSGDKWQDDFLRGQRERFRKIGISVFPSTSRAVRAQARLVSLKMES
ncbi:MAG: acetate--CoA ligase family protein, partial [Alcaligenaceae bacterium]|nr:acetate--CoA ligase family protein [Alcaligenaceae bacterium]